jgi:hypothetical protein
MIHADRTLARRLESHICSEFHGLAEAGRRALPAGDAVCVDVAGGVALWLGQGSPLNQGVGQGMAGPVDDAGMERLEAFYHQRGADALISACPLADPSLVESLGRRGWHVMEFEHVLALELEERTPRAVSGAGLEVRVCTPSDRETWAHIAGLGFSEDEPPGHSHEEFGTIKLCPRGGHPGAGLGGRAAGGDRGSGHRRWCGLVIGRRHAASVPAARRPVGHPGAKVAARPGCRLRTHAEFAKDQRRM